MSLRTRLLILVIAAMLVPAILVGLRFVQNRTSDIDAALSNLSATANDILGDLDEKIQGTAQLHYGLARARDLDTRDKAACSAFLSAVREEYTAVHRHIDHQSGRQPVLRLAANQPDPRSQGSRLLQAGPGCEGVVTLEPVFGRLTGTSVLQIAYPVRAESGELKFILLASFNLQKFAEYHVKRLSNETEILLVDKKGTVLVAPQGKGLDRTGRRIDRELGAVPLCGLSEPRAVPRADRSRRPNLCLGRHPLAFDPRCRTLYPGRTIQGRTGGRRQPPPVRGSGDARGGLAAAARGRVASGHHERRPSGRTAGCDGDETGPRRSERADCAAPSAGRTRRADDAAQRHRRVARAPARRDR